jgi:5-methylcytosine-specific restriction enzyme A
LQEIRKRWMSHSPLCVECDKAGRTRLGTQLDHILALVNGGEDTDDNRQLLCDDCHSAKTAIDIGYTRKPEIGADGYPVGGG